MYRRNKWKLFRNHFINLGLAPILDYRKYHQTENDGGHFRFTGKIESITDGRILWVKGGDLTIPVSLEKTICYLLPENEGDGTPEIPEQIQWNRVSTLNEGVKVFIGGHVKMQNNRLNFISAKKEPLIVIFYNCAETELTGTIIQAARTHNDYWNSLTPISLFIGASLLIFIAASFLNRPAFRLTVISSLVAVFIPILPAIPPGLLFTFIYRRLMWHSQKFRAYRDFARLPLRYLQQGKENCILSTGEKYGFVKINSIQQTAKDIPLLVPGIFNKDKKQDWYFFGILDQNETLPVKPADPFVSFGLLPANLFLNSGRYATRRFVMEAFAWIILLIGILANIIFIMTILLILGAF